MKTVQDLKIGDFVYLPSIETIIKKKIVALRLKTSIDREVEVKTSSCCTENIKTSLNQTKMPANYGKTLYLNFADALREQHKMRIVYLEDINEDIRDLLKKRKEAIQLLNSPLQKEEPLEENTEDI